MPGLLRGKKVALVGNGPSGNDQGRLIDACDFVVRMSRWISQGPKNAGCKISALAGCNDHLEVPHQMHLSRSWEIWCNEAPKYICNEPEHDRPANMRTLMEYADGRAIRIVRNCVHDEILACLRATSLFRQYPPRTDIGIIVVGMALDMGADSIHLWGYDRTGYGRPNDNWASQEFSDPKDQLNHDYRARAHLLAALIDKRVWCGREVDLREVVWHGRPPMPELVPDPVIPQEPTEATITPEDSSQCKSLA